MSCQPTELEIERRNRIRVSVWAYAYEFFGDQMVPDDEYDQVCLTIRPQMETGHVILDEFFREEFSPDTGMWIRKHPELAGIDVLYNRLKQIDKRKSISLNY